jgi:MATE family multidrug resistance protein
MSTLWFLIGAILIGAVTYIGLRGARLRFAAEQSADAIFRQRRAELERDLADGTLEASARQTLEEELARIAVREVRTGSAGDTPRGNRLAALLVLGCAIATGVAMWSQALVAWLVLRRDPFYAPFELHSRGLDAPERKSLGAHLRLGLPMGAAILIEVSGFSFMAIFIARLGTTPVAGHQIAMNLVTLMFMVPLAIASACTTLVSQRVGARDALGARRLAWHGLAIGCAVAALLGAAVSIFDRHIVGLYTQDAVIAAAALPLIAWVALFHFVDAAQTVAAFVLRAWRIATVPLVIYGVALWGIGLGGGFVLAFNLTGAVPASLQGARGFWMSATAGLVVAAVALCGYMAWVLRRMSREAEVTPAASR